MIDLQFHINCLQTQPLLHRLMMMSCMLLSLLSACTTVEPEKDAGLSNLGGVPSGNQAGYPSGNQAGYPSGTPSGTPSGNQNNWANQNQGDRPSLMRIGDKVAIVGQNLHIQLVASDSQNRPLTYGLRSILPMGAKFEKTTGTFDWTPDVSQIGKQFLLTFEVGNGILKDQESISVQVVSADDASGVQAPVAEPVGDLLIPIGRPWQYQLIVTDPNGDQVSYALEGISPMEIPNGLTVDQMGKMSWTPTNEQAGVYELNVIASDPSGLFVNIPVKCIVQEQNQNGENQPPQFADIPPQIAVVGQAFTLTLSAMDDQPQSLVYQVSERTVLPMNASFDRDSASLFWTPTEEQSNQSFAIIFEVSDGEYRDFVRVRIDVQSAMSSGACQADVYDTRPLNLSENQSVQGTLCAQYETDLFNIIIDQEMAIDVKVDFINAQGDIDISLVALNNPNFAPYQSQSSSSDTEEISTLNLTPGTYQVQVLLYGSGQNNYEIIYQRGQALSCSPDSAETGAGNQDIQNASTWQGSSTQSFNLCPGDLDIFEVYLEANQQITVNLRGQFDNPVIDLDLQILDSQGMIVESAGSSGSDEDLFVTVQQAGFYYVKIYPFDSINTQADYSLTITLGDVGNPNVEPMIDPNCMADHLENNNTYQTAKAINGVNLYTGLKECGEGDWYRLNTNTSKSFYAYFSSNTILDASFYNENQEVLTIESIDDHYVDGCDPNFIYCRRYKVPYPSNLLFVNVQAYASTDYEMRLRNGDEHGGSCVIDADCGNGFSCVQLAHGLACAKTCNTDSECGDRVFDRACVYQSNLSASYCVSLCSGGYECQDGLLCDPQVETISFNTSDVCQ